jgi:hypothetical protein
MSARFAVSMHFSLSLEFYRISELEPNKRAIQWESSLNTSFSYSVAPFMASWLLKDIFAAVRNSWCVLFVPTRIQHFGWCSS